MSHSVPPPRRSSVSSMTRGRKMPTVVIAAGGTAGHVVPALAVADELRDRGARVIWAGTRGRAEADSRLGLANRLLAPYARRVCLAFPIAGRQGDKYVVTGRPVPEPVGHVDARAARGRLGVDPEAPCLLVFGGSLGAQSLNLAAV